MARQTSLIINWKTRYWCLYKILFVLLLYFLADECQCLLDINTISNIRNYENLDFDNYSVNGTHNIGSQQYGVYFCTQELVQAYNTAIELVAGSGERDAIIEKWDVIYRPILFCPSSPPAKSSFPEFPGSRNDALHDVLTNKVIRVGTIGASWGSAGDYTQDPPRGFFPDYLRAIISKIARHYNTYIDIQYVRLDDNRILDEVNKKHIHMTDIYFMYSKLYNNNPLQKEFFLGCPSCVSDNIMLVQTSKNILNYFDLRHHIIKSITDEDRIILFQTRANYNAFLHLLPLKTISVVLPGENRKEEAVNHVKSGKALAAISTSKAPNDLMDSSLTEINIGFSVVLGPAFKRTVDPLCVIEYKEMSDESFAYCFKDKKLGYFNFLIITLLCVVLHIGLL